MWVFSAISRRQLSTFVNVRQTMSDPRLFGTATTNFRSAWKFTSPQVPRSYNEFSSRGLRRDAPLALQVSSPQRRSRRVGSGAGASGKADMQGRWRRSAVNRATWVHRFARSGRSLTVDMPIGSIGTQLGAYHQRNCPAATQKSRSLPNVSPPKTHQRVAPAATDTPDRAPIAARGAGPKIRWRPSVALAQQPACEPGPPINHSGAESARSRSLCDFLASR